MLFEHHSCRTYLKEYLSEGLVNGSVPSLRGLAQRLELSPSFLSEILKGKRCLSEEKAMKASGALGLSSSEQEYFQLMVRYDGTKDMALKEGILAQMQLRSGSGKVNDLSVDTFKVMSDWYYAVILELMNVEEFSFSAKTIAERLELPIVTVEEALDMSLIHNCEPKGRPASSLMAGSG